MNRKRIGRLVAGIMILGVLGLTFLMAGLRWEDMVHNDKPLRQAYVIEEDGTRMNGPYCSEDGTILDGGLVCHIEESSRPYTQNEIVRESVGVGLLALAIGVILIVAVYSFIVGRRVSDPAKV